MTGRVRVIPFEEWQRCIAPMWDVTPDSIPIVNNPYRVIEYPLLAWRDRICFFPVEYSEDGVVKGYNAIYNVSDTCIRFRGIYILPEHRGQGAGHRMCELTTKLFPTTFHRVIGFYKESSYETFVKHSDMKMIPGSDWMWSDFSQVKLCVMYKDRGPRPDAYDIEGNRAFLAQNHVDFGYGGHNNLDREWTDEEWYEYVAGSAYNYPDAGINLDF